MRVYHFINEEYGLKDLKEKRLKIARIMELNDPFEFLGMELSDPIFRKAMKETKKALSKNRGILCFSKTWTNPVQWAHYADNHRGFCLGFDIPSEKLTRVNYVKKRLSHNGEIDEALMKKFLATKFEHWSYEQEYRAFLSLQDEDDGLYYASFSESMDLKQVIIGTSSRVSRSKVNSLVGSGVEIFKARAAFQSFNVVRNKSKDVRA